MHLFILLYPTVTTRCTETTIHGAKWEWEGVQTRISSVDILFLYLTCDPSERLRILTRVEVADLKHERGDC
jgi:hypothetical protein